MIRLSGIALATLAMVACGSENKPQMVNQIQHATGPAWVNRGSGAFGGDKGRVFYGVGIASGIRNRAMSRSTSDARARAEIAKILDQYLSFLNKGDPAASPAGTDKSGSDELRIQQALKDYSQMELSGVSVVDHWIDSDGTEWALAQLDMDQFKNGFDKMKEPDADKTKEPNPVREAARARLRANADRAFDALSSEESRHSGATQPPP